MGIRRKQQVSGEGFRSRSRISPETEMFAEEGSGRGIGGLRIPRREEKQEENQQSLFLLDTSEGGAPQLATSPHFRRGKVMVSGG